MRSRNFIVHDLNQGIQLAEMAAKSSVPITIFSPPGGGSSIGPEAFLEIVNLIRSKFPEVKMLAILDCGDDAGVALAAMRRGLNNIHSQLTGEKLKKLKQIALTNGVKIHTKPKNVIDLELVKNLTEVFDNQLNVVQPKADPSCRLYLISPPKINLPLFKSNLLQAFEGGPINAVQLRLKDTNDDQIRRTAEAILPIVKKYGSVLIMNDRPDLARETGCDGVHIGQNDGSYESARKAIGNNGIIGITCHDSRHLAMEAGEKGADYVAFGAFFSSTTKVTSFQPKIDLIKIWNETTLISSVAIGGIDHVNCKPLIEAGVNYLAVISAVWDYPEGPKKAVNKFTQIFLDQ